MDLLPTDENIRKTIEEDLLGRNEYLGYFIQLLNSIEGSYTIALDGQWGSGKTFFVKQAQAVLEAYNPNLTIDDADTIQNKMQVYLGQAELEPQFPIYYDAWLNDNDTDPIISLLYSIAEAHSYFTKRDIESMEGVKDAGVAVIKMLGGPDLKTFENLFSAKSCMDAKAKAVDLFKQINKFFNELHIEKGNRLVIFVDELDRCKPTFAIKFLERIKHYFEHPNITFVFSVNIAELSHTVQNYYGKDFDAGRYLNRFFDYTFRLPPVPMELYYRAQGVDDNIVYNHMVKIVIQELHLELREVVKFLGNAKIFEKKIPEIHNGFAAFMDVSSMQYVGQIVVPVLMGIQLKYPDKYESFINGEIEEPFLKIITKEFSGYWTINPFKEYDNRIAKRDKSIEAKELYDALFKLSNRDVEMEVEGIKINEHLRSWMLQVASGMSNFSDFSTKE